MILNCTKKNCSIILTISIILSVWDVGHTQMPGWKTVRDRDKNIYFIDTTGRIRTSGLPEFQFRAVSTDGLDYYLEQGILLIKSRHTIEGLTLLRSIMAMPPSGNRSYRIQAAAAAELNRLSRMSGTRYKFLEKKASLLLYRNNRTVTVLNTSVGYSFNVPCRLDVIRHSIRESHHYLRSGMLCGLSLSLPHDSHDATPSTFDALIAIEGERLKGHIPDVARIEERWTTLLSSSNIQKRVLDQTESRSLYFYTGSSSPGITGFELFACNENKGYFIRTVSGRTLQDSERSVIEEILRSFKAR